MISPVVPRAEDVIESMELRMGLKSDGEKMIGEDVDLLRGDGDDRLEVVEIRG